MRVLKNVVWLFLLVAVQQASALGLSGVVERTFSVRPGGRLIVKAESATLRIATGTSDQVQLEVDERNGDLNDFDIRFDQAGNDVILEIEKRGSWGRWFSWGGRGIRVDARIPLEFNLDLKTSGGSISIDALKGETMAKTSGGSIDLGNIEGPVTARTSGGSITLKQGVGEADLDTSGGSIHIGDVDGSVSAHTSGGSITVSSVLGDLRVGTSGGGIRIDEVIGALDAKTSGGSIRARIPRPVNGDCSLTTSGGGITVRIGPDAGFTVDAKTSGGTVKTDIPVTTRSVSKSALRGRLGDGGPLLRMRTSGGSIRIEEDR